MAIYRNTFANGLFNRNYQVGYFFYADQAQPLIDHLSCPTRKEVGVLYLHAIGQSTAGVG